MQNLPQIPDREKLKCPRCDSTNTKFCYYNNYNLSQPRHFCKSCRRYWTKGGALRNIPVGGGGSKKNAKRGSAAPAAGRRPASASASASSDEKNETLLPLSGDSFGQGQFSNFTEVTGRDEALLPVRGYDFFEQGQFGNFTGASGRDETLLPVKGYDFFEQGQFGNFLEMGQKNESEALSLKEDDFGQGQFGNFGAMTGGFRSLLLGSSSEVQFGGLYDGLGPNGLNLQTSDYFGDPGSGQNMDPQAGGFLDIGGGGGGGCWGWRR